MNFNARMHIKVLLITNVTKCDLRNNCVILAIFKSINDYSGFGLDIHSQKAPYMLTCQHGICSLN